MKTNMSQRLMGITGIIGAVIPLSMLIRAYFGLPTDGFFGFVLPTTAAVAAVSILIYSLVRARGSK
jgi:hypothetical protein